METDQALALLSEVCARYQGTLADHQSLQTALQTVRDALDAEPEVAEVVEEA